MDSMQLQAAKGGTETEEEEEEMAVEDGLIIWERGEERRKGKEKGDWEVAERE